MQTLLARLRNWGETRRKSGVYSWCFLGTKGKDGVPAATDPCPRAIQDRRQAYLPVQRGDPEPVWCADGHPGGNGSLRLRGAAAEGPKPGKSAPQLHE